MDLFHTNDSEKLAIDVARSLIMAGVPVFAAEPCPENCTVKPKKGPPHRGGPGKYHIPLHWEKTIPAMVNLDRWQPGWALAAVGGHAVDFLDVDPRNGGDASLAELHAHGHVPRILAEAKTPSGGVHYMITATGERKSTGFMPGLDLQSGGPDGVGRGFVWIAPTVRMSKANQDQGALRAYEWVQLPDPEMIQEYAGTVDPTTEGIVARVTARKLSPRESALPTASLDDPFLTASTAHGVGRDFTMAEAQAFCLRSLMDLRAAPVGMIEEQCNVAATVLSHFVPNFWTVDQAMAILADGLSHTAYDPNGPSDWTVEKFRSVLDGSRPVGDPWVATRKPEPAAPPAQTVAAEPGEESLSTLEKLRRKLVPASALAEMEAPEPLVWDLLDMDTESWMIGAPGSLKSFVALDLAGHIGTGREWQGHRVRQGPVLYVAAEGARGLVLRTRAWEKSFGPMSGVIFLPYPVQVSSNDGQWAALVALAAELKPVMVVIDTQARVTVGLEENSAKDMGILTNAVGMLKRATGACVLVVHHTGRNGGDARGSSALDGAQDTELKIQRSQDRKALSAKVIQDKQKDMAEGDRDGLIVHFRVVDLGVDPRTGRALSSLVMKDRDAFLEAEGFDVNVDPRQPWLPQFHQKDIWRRRYLDTLFTFAPAGVGLTKPDLDGLMKVHWAEEWPKDGARAGGPKKAWADLVALRDDQGEPIVDNVGSQRWGVTSLTVRAALTDELGPPRAAPPASGEGSE